LAFALILAIIGLLSDGMQYVWGAWAWGRYAGVIRNVRRAKRDSDDNALEKSLKAAAGWGLTAIEIGKGERLDGHFGEHPTWSPRFITVWANRFFWCKIVLTVFSYLLILIHSLTSLPVWSSTVPTDASTSVPVSTPYTSELPSLTAPTP
jgi:hypothetical protein